MKQKKSALVIGLGRFGIHLARKLQELGDEVLVMDKNKDLINVYGVEFLGGAVCGNYTNEMTLKQAGAESMDIAFITDGDDFESNIITTYILKEKLKIPTVSVRARDEIEQELLKRAGADEIIYVEGEAADSIAIRHSVDNVYDYISIAGNLSIFEIPVPHSWVKHSLIEMNIRKKFKINVVAIKNGGSINHSPMPEYIFQKDDHLIVIGDDKNVYNVIDNI